MKAFLALLSYFPYILAGIVAVQGSLPNAPGATKKELILNAVLAAASVGEQVPEAHVSAISKFIDVTVATLKGTGLLGFVAKTAPTV